MVLLSKNDNFYLSFIPISIHTVISLRDFNSYRIIHRHIHALAIKMVH